MVRVLSATSGAGGGGGEWNLFKAPPTGNNLPRKAAHIPATVTMEAPLKLRSTFLLPPTSVTRTELTLGQVGAVPSHLSRLVVPGSTSPTSAWQLSDHCLGTKAPRRPWRGLEFEAVSLKRG